MNCSKHYKILYFNFSTDVLHEIFGLCYCINYGTKNG